MRPLNVEAGQLGADFSVEPQGRFIAGRLALELALLGTHLSRAPSQAAVTIAHHLDKV